MHFDSTITDGKISQQIMAYKMFFQRKRNEVGVVVDMVSLHRLTKWRVYDIKIDDIGILFKFFVITIYAGWRIQCFFVGDADDIRKSLLGKGIVLEDTPAGTTLGAGLNGVLF